MSALSKMAGPEAMAENINHRDINPNIEFLYKTMLERDPCKRRVKPVSSHLLQLDFASLDNSSDDSDFKVSKDDDDDDDDDDSDNDDEGEDNDDEDDDDKDVSTSSSDDEVSIEQHGLTGSGGNVESDSDRAGDEAIGSATAKDTTLKTQSNKTTSEGVAGAGPSSVSGNQNFKVLICCVCLRDNSGMDDEIIECDSCATTVHEGCYGVNESQSMTSTESSASMEPWFCDACKAGIKPSCELCPNSGGIYKETDAGRWVHLVCALYVPGVAFGDVDKLSNVTLFEMNYAKWGAKECSLCEDARFARTGVCIGCDAGMCRTYFHVTCAQREGLLMEATPDEEIADPFYAYCKQHAAKASARIQRRNYLAVQSSVKRAVNDQRLDLTSDSKIRLMRKLVKHQQKYEAARDFRQPSWVPPEKLPRLLFTSAYALRQLLKKSELLGLSAQDEDQSRDVRKRWHAAPAFNNDFVAYFLDREERITTMRRSVRDLIAQKEKLQGQERVLHVKYDKFQSESNRLQQDSSELKAACEKLWTIVTSLPNGRHVRMTEVINFRRVNLLARSPVAARKDTPKSPPTCIHSCGVCKKSTDQHLLAKCDKCRLYLHLHCLDPPLARMPKKTKLQGWQCSRCASASSGDDDADEAVAADKPRRLRAKGLLREPLKLSTQLLRGVRGGVVRRAKGGLGRRGRGGRTLSATELSRKMSYVRRKGMANMKPLSRVIRHPRSPSKNNSRSASNSKSPVTDKSSRLRYPTSSCRVELTRNIDITRRNTASVKCMVCSCAGDPHTAVTCARCSDAYHLTCLKPVLTTAPSTSWLCAACRGAHDNDDQNIALPSTSTNSSGAVTSARAASISSRKRRGLAARRPANQSLRRNSSVTKKSTSPSRSNPSPPSSPTSSRKKGVTGTTGPVISGRIVKRKTNKFAAVGIVSKATRTNANGQGVRRKVGGAGVRLRGGMVSGRGRGGGVRAVGANRTVIAAKNRLSTALNELVKKGRGAHSPPHTGSIPPMAVYKVEREVGGAGAVSPSQHDLTVASRTPAPVKIFPNLRILSQAAEIVESRPERPDQPIPSHLSAQSSSSPSSPIRQSSSSSTSVALKPLLLSSSSSSPTKRLVVTPRSPTATSPRILSHPALGGGSAGGSGVAHGGGTRGGGASGVGGLTQEQGGRDIGVVGQGKIVGGVCLQSNFYNISGKVSDSHTDTVIEINISDDDDNEDDKTAKTDD